MPECHLYYATAPVRRHQSCCEITCSLCGFTRTDVRTYPAVPADAQCVYRVRKARIKVVIFFLKMIMDTFSLLEKSGDLCVGAHLRSVAGLLETALCGRVMADGTGSIVLCIVKTRLTPLDVSMLATWLHNEKNSTIRPQSQDTHKNFYI